MILGRNSFFSYLYPRRDCNAKQLAVRCAIRGRDHRADGATLVRHSAQAHRKRGIAYLIKGDHDLAIKDFDEAIRLDPSDASAYKNRCWAHGSMHRPKEALRDCNESLRLRPDEPSALDSRALAYWLLGDQDRARQDLERARQIAPAIPAWQHRFREFERMF